MTDKLECDNGLVRIIQTMALFVAMGDGHVSEEELEYLDQEAPGLIRHCLASRPALDALLEGEDIEAVMAKIPGKIEHTISMGMLFGGPPAWVEEALQKRAASGDIASYELRFANRIDDPIDQMVAHYFARRLLTFSGLPTEGEVKAYGLMLMGWMGSELDGSIVESLEGSANVVFPLLFGLPPADGSSAVDEDEGDDDDDDYDDGVR